MAEASKGKELARKLGIKEGMSIAVMNPPYGFVQSLIEIREMLRTMHTDVKMREAVNVDIYVYFSRGRKGLEEIFPRLVEDLAAGGTLWIGWMKPKVLKADLNEKIVREIGQKHGLKEAGTMAFSDDWPMMKFVRAGEKK